jgi:hypothetical protein
MQGFRAFFFVFLFTLLGVFYSSVSNAQENAGITLVPATVEKGANPGEVLEETLKITNESQIEREYFVYKRNIKGVEAGGVPIFAEEGSEKTAFEMSEWIDIPSDPIRVPPNSTVDLPITIRVPDSATPGSHFSGIFISQEPPKMRTLGAGVGYEVASIFSIRISGDIIDTARIRAFSTDKLLYGSKNVVFNTKIENQGNILIRPRGPVSIKSMFSSKPETFTVNESLAGVFPGTTRDFQFAWDAEGIGFGRYEAVLALAYDGEDGQKTIDASLYFWVFPTKIILAVLAGFVGIIAIGYVLTRYYINQAIMRAAGGRRIQPQRYRKQVGISRFAFVFVTLMGVSVLFLLALLIFFA